MPDVPRSSQFDDIYFSKEDGLAETRHVFLEGNNLPNAWQDKAQFTIFEAGFGTGLNFFATWKLFEETKQAGQSLDFISVEKYPLRANEIREALSQWDVHFDGRIERFILQYPLNIAGFHRVKLTSDVTLTLIFDDINEALPQITADVDCWFLDGFTPSKNPQMWSDVLFETMAHLSVQGACMATFSAAGHVRRGLEKVGFKVHKREGFGHKREMLTGVFKQECPQERHRGKREDTLQRQDKKIVIIGAGLAGTAMGYTLNQYGFDVTLYEQSDKVASGASGNKVGFYNPRFTAQRDEVSDFFVPAYSSLIKLGQAHGSAFDFNPCGALHLINSPEKKRRFEKLIKNWHWHEDHARIVDMQEASNIAGIQLKEDCLYLPDSGSLCPRKLVEFYAKNLKIEYNTKIKNLEDLDAYIIILCAAYRGKKFEESRWLPLKAIRGQSTFVESTTLSSQLKCNLHYGGYLSACVEGQHAVGATFQRWLDHCDVLEEDHVMNIGRIKEFVPSLGNEEFKIQSGWAGLRTASQDRIPIVGKLLETKNIYTSTAFGSYGILGTLTAAHYMADMLRFNTYQEAVCLPKRTQYALSPQHYVDRAHKKGRVLI